MTDGERKTWLPIAVLGVALAAWACVFALGAYLQLGADQPHHDLRKVVIILSAMGLFLGWWGWLLWLRSRRNR